MQSISDRGFVLRTQDSGEADKYIVVLTENHGLIDTIARGARRPNSKKASHLDLLNLIKFSTSRSDTPKFITQAEAQKFYPDIKSSLNKTTYALSFAEIIAHSLPKEVEDREIFLSLENYLDSLEVQNSDEIKKNARKFGLYLLRHLGYPPPKDGSTSLTKYFETLMNRHLVSQELNKK